MCLISFWINTHHLYSPSIDVLMIPSVLALFVFQGAVRHSLQDRLSKGSSGRTRDEIYLKLRTSTGKPIIICLSSSYF